MPANLRFLITVLLLGSAAGFLQFHPSESVPEHEPLASLPTQLDRWQGVEESIPPDILQVLGSGDFLQRTYFEQSDDEPIQLFIAYFPTQRAGDTIHSPQNCLPGSGWAPLESSRIVVNVHGHDPFQANRYLVGRGEDRQLVLYWYLSHDRAVASEYWAKIYLVEDAVRFNRSDGAVIRLSTVLHPHESPTRAQRLLVEFAQELFPELNRYVPR